MSTIIIYIRRTAFFFLFFVGITFGAEQLRIEVFHLESHPPVRARQLLIAHSDWQSPVLTHDLNGKAVSPIELLPIPVFSVSGQRGQLSEAAIEIINHETEPLQLQAIEHPSDRFITILETLTEGQRYRLRLRLRPDGPGGKKTEPILVKTSSKTTPVLKIPAHTYLRERVYTFPEEVNLGAVPLADLQQAPELLEQLTQTLTVYQVGGKDLQVKVSSDLPLLQLEIKKGTARDHCEVIISLVKEKLWDGPVEGAIVIETNDPEFPTLTVPVSGHFSGKPQ